MIKEAKNIDFITSGRQPSEKDFLRISEWIHKNKNKNKNKGAATLSKKLSAKKSNSPNKRLAAIRIDS